MGLLEGVCAAMDAAHESGIVHRDLKPGNILFAQGVVKVADFGLAHLIEEEDHTLTAGHIIGSPHYMSPEQWQSIPADARTDVYSLGVIAYEALTGTHPFKGGSTRAILAAHLTGVPAPPSQLRRRSSRGRVARGAEGDRAGAGRPLRRARARSRRRWPRLCRPSPARARSRSSRSASPAKASGPAR